LEAAERPDGAREFRFWNLDDVLFTHTIGIFARRGSGKTTVTMNLLQAKTRIPRGIVICPTPEAVVVYADAIPLSYIYDYFDEEVLTRIMNYQHSVKVRLHQQYRVEVAEREQRSEADKAPRWARRMHALKERLTGQELTEQQLEIHIAREQYEFEIENSRLLEDRKSWANTRRLQLQEPYSMFCVLDDLSSDPDAVRSRVMKKLMDNGRHYLMLLIITCQYSMDFPAACRGGLDWVVIFFDTLRPNLKRLYENYVGEFSDQRIFADALAECARRNCCLVINKRSRSPNLYESVFLFRPEPVWLITRMFGNEQYMMVHDMFYDEHKYELSQGGGAGGVGAEDQSDPNNTALSATGGQPIGGPAGGKMGPAKKKRAKPAAKSVKGSFSIEGLQKQTGKGSRGGGGGGGGKKGAKKAAGGALEGPEFGEMGGDSEEEDEDEQQKRELNVDIKKRVLEMRQRLKASGREAQEHAAAALGMDPEDIGPRAAATASLPDLDEPPITAAAEPNRDHRFSHSSSSASSNQRHDSQERNSSVHPVGGNWGSGNGNRSTPPQNGQHQAFWGFPAADARETEERYGVEAYASASARASRQPGAGAGDAQVNHTPEDHPYAYGNRAGSYKGTRTGDPGYGNASASGAGIYGGTRVGDAAYGIGTEYERPGVQYGSQPETTGQSNGYYYSGAEYDRQGGYGSQPATTGQSNGYYAGASQAQTFAPPQRIDNNRAGPLDNRAGLLEAGTSQGIGHGNGSSWASAGAVASSAGVSSHLSYASQAQNGQQQWKTEWTQVQPTSYGGLAWPAQG
jgi:hypothetical protein